MFKREKKPKTSLTVRMDQDTLRDFRESLRKRGQNPNSFINALATKIAADPGCLATINAEIL